MSISGILVFILTVSLGNVLINNRTVCYFLNGDRSFSYWQNIWTLSFFLSSRTRSYVSRCMQQYQADEPISHPKHRDTWLITQHLLFTCCKTNLPLSWLKNYSLTDFTIQLLKAPFCSANFPLFPYPINQEKPFLSMSPFAILMKSSLILSSKIVLRQDF